MDSVLEQVRAAEINAVAGLFGSRSRILELGGGNGYQAKLLSSAGYDVTSIDISIRPATKSPYYPVQEYDGRNIPFDGASFDGVFSSNVLEHIPDINWTLSELRRVTRKNGVGVHLLPTVTWRLWTIGTHYPWLISELVKRGSKSAVSESNVMSTRARPISVRLRNLLGLAPHGEYPNALSELYYFSKSRWQKVFNANGFETIEYRDNGLFYTGHMLAKSANVDLRRTMARYIGASCHVFVLRSKD